VGNGPYDLALADYNGDGKLDLATANRDDETVTVRLSKSDVFDEKITPEPSIGGDLTHIEAGDLDGDSYVDLVVLKTLGGSTSAVSFLYNHGTGTFNLPIDRSITATPEGLALGDIDDDGDQDIVIANSHPPFSVIIILNDASRKWTDGKELELPNAPSDVALVDLNGDKLLDIAATSIEGGLSVFLNSIDGYDSRKDMGFKLQQALTSGDIDGDGDEDVLTVSRAESSVRIGLNPGSGDVTEEGLFIIGNNPTDIVARDFDGDGDKDIGVCNLGDGTASVVLNNGLGRFAWYDPQYITSSGRIATGDFDADGDHDIISSNYDTSTIEIVFNEGDGLEWNVVEYESHKVVSSEGIRGSEPFYPTVADFDNDKDLDFIYGEELSYSIIFMENVDGEGNFKNESVAKKGGPNLLDSPPFVAEAVDVELDGDLDIVTNHVNWQHLSVLINNGDGTYDRRLNISTVPHYGYDLAVHDYDGDGDGDIITANYGVSLNFDDTISFFRNDMKTSGNFTFAKDITLKKGPRTLHIADMNNDGHGDIVVAFAYRKGLKDIDRGEVAVMFWTGIGEYSDPKYYTAGILPGEVYITDLNEDGNGDIICLNQGTGSGGSMSIYINDGDRSFKPQLEFTGFPFAYPVYRDLDGDGREEIILPALSTHLLFYRWLYHPNTLRVDVGADGTPDLEEPGIVRKLDEPLDFTEALNTYLDKNRDAETDSVKVPLKFSSLQAGIIRLSNLKIEYQKKTVTPDGEDGFKFDINNRESQLLIGFVILLIVVSLLIGKPAPPEEVVAAEKKSKKKKKGKKKKMEKKPAKKKGKKKKKKKEEETPYKIEVVKTKDERRHDRLAKSRLKRDMEKKGKKKKE
jgi:hypothetical protein